MKLSPEHIKLYKAIDKIIWNDWDPINMKGNGGPWDEYESYLLSIFSLKIRGADIETIASALSNIETNEMGYEDGYERCSIVAEKIFNLNFDPNSQGLRSYEE